MQGYNLRVQIWRPAISDDEVGGASTAYSLFIDNIPARLQAQLLDDDIMEFARGRETAKAYRLTCQSPNLDIRENDRLLISKPTNHAHYGKNFRVEKVNHANYYPRDYVILTVSLSEEAHT